MFQARHLKNLLLVALCGGLLGAPATAPADDTVVIDVNNTKRSLYPIALPMADGSDGGLTKMVTDVQSFDLAVSGWFRVVDPRSFLADLKKEGLEIEPQKWRDVGAFGVVKHKIT